MRTSACPSCATAQQTLWPLCCSPDRAVLERGKRRRPGGAGGERAQRDRALHLLRHCAALARPRPRATVLAGTGPGDGHRDTMTSLAHACVARAGKQRGAPMSISVPNGAPWAAACNEFHMNGDFNGWMAEVFSIWVGDAICRTRPKDPISMPEYKSLPDRVESPRREVVRSSAGAGVVYPPFWGVIRVAYPKA